MPVLELAPDLALLKTIIEAPDLVIDVGSGNGSFYLQARATWPNVPIVSFEPKPELHGPQEDVDANHIKYRVALGAKAESRLFNLTQAKESNSFLGFLPGNPLENHHRIIDTEEIEVRTLDSFELQGSNILLKMDVQGWELEVLKGATETLKNVKAIYAEVAHVQQYKDQPLVHEVDAWMAEHGFRKTHVVNSCMPDIWNNAVYVHDSVIGELPTINTETPVRLNLGSGDSKLPGYIPIDRKFGQEVYPLDYPDNSVDEVRASHILEHASFDEAGKWLKEWYRVIKPGGSIKLAVPGFEKVVEVGKTDHRWPKYLMGGQTDANDYHKSVWTERGLRDAMWEVGFEKVRHWSCTADDIDTAILPVSLNLCGIKPIEKEPVRIEACMSIPRIGWNDAWMSIMSSLSTYGIKLRTMNGAFWGQCLQREFEDCCKAGVEWILTIDYDSMVSPETLDTLIKEFRDNPHIDALAGLQLRRNAYESLLTTGKKEDIPAGEAPVAAKTAHFGLTLIRVDRLLQVPKPWFWGQPDKNGEWGPERIDDDIWFWKQWEKAGNNLFVSTRAKVGHLELVVSDYDDEYNPVHMYVPGWRNLKMKGGTHGDLPDARPVSSAVGNSPGGNGGGVIPECGARTFASAHCPAVHDGEANRNGHDATCNGSENGAAKAS